MYLHSEIFSHLSTEQTEDNICASKRGNHLTKVAFAFSGGLFDF